LHGANRLGGNSLSDLLVFGQRAGEYAATFAKEHSLGNIDNGELKSTETWALQPFERKNSVNPYTVQHRLQDVMQDLVGIVRQEQEMLQALDRIQELKTTSERVSVDGNREYNAGWHTALDLYHLLTVSEIVTRAALERKESRGAHFRDDFPGKNNPFGAFNIVARKGTDGAMQFSHEPVSPLRQDLQQIIEEMK
jgi:succinate dehydrogenase / fumarate reductase flavoprotein subunit